MQADIGKTSEAAERCVLPMNTEGKLVLPGQTAQITSRPQRVAFRPERVFISDATSWDRVEGPSPAAPHRSWWRRMFGMGASRQEMLAIQLAQLNAEMVALRDVMASMSKPRGACEWSVNDITIANRSQFTQSGSLPGDMFSSRVIDMFVTFEVARVGVDVNMIVTYNGPAPRGCMFYGSIVGTAVADDKEIEPTPKIAA